MAIARAPKEKQPIQTQQSFDTHELTPFACHLNPQSLVTKNVELVQIIKISTSAGLTDDQFRDQIRGAINEFVDASKIAVWVHTMRTQKRIVEKGDEGFTRHIDILWKKALPDELRYGNTIYISLVIDFKKFPLWHPQNYLRALHNKSEQKRFNRIIDEHNHEITAASDNLVAKLEKFGARRLEIVKRDELYYSEPMEFLHKLLTFIDEPVPVSLGDISRNLYREFFNFNLYNGQITIAHKNGTYYGAVIALKESALLTANSLKEILNTGYEFVICESIDFAFGNKKLPEYKYQKYVNSLTDDKRFVEMMGGRDKDPVPENFALHQVSILLVRPSAKDFTAALGDISRKLEELGIVSYVEDIYLERSFWAILSANFSFLKRQSLISHDEIAAFATLGNDKFTAVEDCMFGEPVTFFENHTGGAFSLHFLNEGMSNILLAGDIPEQKHVLGNLIAAQVARFPIKIIYYDETGRYKNFADSIGAEYLETLDLESIKAKIENKSLVVINSLKKLFEEINPDDIFDFLDFAASKNATVMLMAAYADNAEALLPNFHTQIFLNGDPEKHPDHFDLFEDELKIIDLLEPGSFYFKHGYDEVVLNFHPTDKLVKDLMQGGSK